MKSPLRHIAETLTGATLREKPIAALGKRGRVLLMQLGDLGADGAIRTRHMIPIAHQSFFDKFTIQTGDIVFRGRGAGIVATVMPATELPIVVASPLMIIRPDVNKVDPHYLVWALINENARRHYAERSQGSNIIGIGKRDLDQLEIDLPPLHVQKKIGQLKRLETEEQHLLNRYQKAKTRLVETMIFDAIQKEKTA